MKKIIFGKRGNIVIVLMFAVLIFSVVVVTLKLTSSNLLLAKKTLATGSEFYTYETIMDVSMDSTCQTLATYTARLNEVATDLNSYTLILKELDNSFTNNNGELTSKNLLEILNAAMEESSAKEKIIASLGSKHNATAKFYSLKPMQLDIDNYDNVVKYDTGDKVYLKDFDITGIVEIKGITVTKTFRLKNLYIELLYGESETSGKIEIDECLVQTVDVSYN